MIQASHSSTRPIRVAQVVAGMDAAGLETWLMAVLRSIDRQRFHIDFITNTDRECHFDQEIRALGSQLINCPPARRPGAYARSLRQALKEHGPYDVVHSHLHHFSGFVLRVAKQQGVPVRIAHSHSDRSAVQAKASWLRKLYLRTTEHWIDRYATRGLSVSPPAGASLFPDWSDDRRWQVLYCGIDLAPFRQRGDGRQLRRQLGLPEDALVLGHVGTFRKPKNHKFLVQVASEVFAREPRARLLLVSDGPLRSSIEAEVQRLGIADRVVFTGFVEDQLQYVRDVMDFFLFPSLWEGLPLSVVEAQAAGLPCLLSEVITTDVEVVPGMVRRASLDEPAAHWAEKLLRQVQETPAELRSSALDRIASSPFDIRQCVRQLEAIYAQS